MLKSLSSWGVFISLVSLRVSLLLSSRFSDSFLSGLLFPRFLSALSLIPTVEVSIKTISPLELSFSKLNVSYFALDSLPLLSDISLVEVLSVVSLEESLSVMSLV